MNNVPDDCTVRLVDLPTAVGGAITEHPDGHIDIYVNARHSYDGQLRDLEHELGHWRHDDLNNAMDIFEVENRDARQLPPLIRARGLLPKQPDPPTQPDLPKPEPTPLTYHQRRVLASALSELDRFVFSDEMMYGL